ncbi:MAG: hypothetical protein HY272_03105 [Gammaproteobacteria bacterium]|nr:hypothetical protein [Gammaproteobacteria bacterium]
MKSLIKVAILLGSMASSVVFAASGSWTGTLLGTYWDAKRVGAGVGGLTGTGCPLQGLMIYDGNVPGNTDLAAVASSLDVAYTTGKTITIWYNGCTASGHPAITNIQVGVFNHLGN